MATLRRKGNSSKNTPKLGPRRSERNKTAVTEDAESDLDVDSSEETEQVSTEEELPKENKHRQSLFFANMSLDVLAQVASATLEKEPKTENRRPQRKVPKRGVQNCDILNLQQIQQLSERSLLNLFSEMTSNEMTRNFTFTCFLMPGECTEHFSSFGSESKSRLQMKNHLYRHLEQLEVADEKAKGKLDFTAEPMPARKRRISEMAKDKSKGRRKASNFTSLKNKRNQDILILPKGQLISLAELTERHQPNPEMTSILKKPNISKAKDVSSENTSPQKADMPISSKACMKDAAVSPTKRRASKPLANKQHVPQSTDSEVSKGSVKSSQKLTCKKNGREAVSDSENVECALQEETERRIEENEQFIIDLLRRTQPHHDHCYTTMFGKKRGIDTLDIDSSDSDEEGDITVDVGDSTSYYGNFLPQTRRSIVPILLFRRVPGEEGTPMVCCEEIVGNEDEEGDEGHTGQRPYPPMPKSALAKRGRIPVPEEEDLSFSEDEEGSPTFKRRKKVEKEGTAEWERKSALRCIRELKFKKKDDRGVPLICKICKDKTFTASATLMYHYRSHAGIKPFVCLICNTTFTRQHSLNYHMLIHNNQSRFTCKDCGRKFRHPSHFKEHLRRHTGETPFECTDCPQKFKTRNTYKRHLKTRHGKLLTANGIHIMSREEFMKVRTKPYKKGEEDDSEEEIPEEDLLESGDEGSNSDTAPLLRGSPMFLSTYSGEGVLPVQHDAVQEKMSSQPVNITRDRGTPVQQLAQQLVSQAASHQLDTTVPVHFSQGHLTPQLAVQTSQLHGQILSTGQFLVPVDFKLVMS